MSILCPESERKRDKKSSHTTRFQNLRPSDGRRLKNGRRSAANKIVGADERGATRSAAGDAILVGRRHFCRSIDRLQALAAPKKSIKTLYLQHD